MGSSDLSFGKIASTPTKHAWSQAYNAGSLFVVLSLTLKNSEEEHEALATIGKKFLNDLETEFFTLDAKNLTGIQTVLEKVAKDVPDSIDLTAVTAFYKEKSLYLFLIGEGSVILKRGSQVGTLLTQNESETRDLKTASGHVEKNDTVLLASSTFRKVISKDVLIDALSADDVDDTIEALTPHIHKLDEGSASAIVFRVQKGTETTSEVSSSMLQEDDETPTEASAPDKKTDEPTEEPQDEDEASPITSAEEYMHPHTKQNTKSRLQNVLSSLKLPPFVSSLSHRKKVFLSVAVILVFVLFASIFFTIQTQQAREREALFNEVYPEALTNYEEAEGLLTLNKALARDELEKAQEILAKTEGKFPQGTAEYEQTEELSKKIEELLTQVGDSRTLEAEEISEDEVLLLSVLMPNGRIDSVEDDTSVYYLTDTMVESIRKGSKSEQTLIENDGDWEEGVSLGKFGSNFYVLDTEEGIHKFVPSGNDYTVSDYLTEDVDLSDAVAMAIDASIYVLFENGEVQKFTRGSEESFTLSGIETPLNNPTDIVTSEDMDNIYILDPGTARIVKVNKQGAFEEEFQTGVLQNASAIAISQDEGTAYILSSSKLYEISL